MNKKYTADDFANARFAEHESGRAVAIRWTDDYEDRPEREWSYERPLNNRFSKEASSQEMANMGGWVPVPTKPTLTAGAAGRHSYLLGPDVETPRVIDYLEALGIEVIPDPEPTNTEKLAKLIGGAINSSAWHDEHALAEYLTDNGVKVEN